MAYTLTIVRGAQPNANGEELQLSDVKVTPELLRRLGDAGLDEDDTDIWVLVTPAGEDTGELYNVVGAVEYGWTHADDQAGRIPQEEIKFVNLTPHAVTVYPPDTTDQIEPGAVQPILVIPPSGRQVRLGMGTLDDGLVEGGIPVATVFYMDDQELPDSMPGIVPGVRYIVPRVIAEAWRNRRQDLRIPHRLVRDSSGAVLGCRALGKVD